MKNSDSYHYPEPIKGFHAVEFFRKIKRRVSRKIVSMTDDEYRAWSKALHEKHAASLAAGKAFGL